MLHERGPLNPSACLIANELFGMGLGANGQLGQNDVVSRSSPTQIVGTNWLGVSAGFCTGYATRTDGTLWAWGFNGNGQLGDNTRTHKSTPVQIAGANWVKPSGGTQFAAALKNDRTLWTWGLGTAGQLGNNAILNASTPVQVPGVDWKAIDVSACNILALRTDGTLWAWGINTNGQLGISAITHRSSPTQVPGTTWCAVSAGTTSAAIKTDGTLWAWGANTNGNLGQGDRVHRSSPVQIPGTTWCAVESGANHVLALRTDNTLWVWGINANGQLGISSVAPRSSPVQIPGTNWCEIFPITNGTSSFAKRTDGTLWGWGLNTSGQLGLNSVANYSSPVQIPGTGWTKLGSSSTNTFMANNNIAVKGTFTGHDLSNVWGNDPKFIQFSPSSNPALNDDIYARDFRFCMGPRSKIIEANVITRMSSTGLTGYIYGGTTNGWSTIQLFDNNGDIGADLGEKSSSGFSSTWTNLFAKVANPSITPSQAMSNTFGVRLSSLSTGSPAPTSCVDSIHIRLTTENSANAVSQGPQFYQWSNIGDVI